MGQCEWALAGSLFLHTNSPVGSATYSLHFSLCVVAGLKQAGLDRRTRLAGLHLIKLAAPPV